MNNENQGKNSQQKRLESAEISLQKAKELILEHIPNEEIQAIYLKGSYVQGELQEGSDVDIVVILKTERYLLDVYKLTNDFGNTTPIPFQTVAYTLGELQTGQIIHNRTNKPTSVSYFVKHLDHLPLIYGTKPEGRLFTRTDLKDLTVSIANFRKIFLPDYETGKFAFASLIKAVLWLIEREQRVLGNFDDYSWQKLANSIKDQNHIIHDTLKYRRAEVVTEGQKKEYIGKLNKYLEMLEGEYKN